MNIDTTNLVKRVLEVAGEVEVCEHRIKHEILRAAQRGDAHRVADLVQRWLEGPVADVLDDEPGDQRTARNSACGRRGH